MDIGKVTLVDIEKEMREAYLDYAMSVITSRALPDVRDGLKPVQRRILYTMYDNGLRPDRPYKKSAATVGDVLGKYHPHGDGAVYDAMVRLAQDFSLRYPLIDGQGNFGSIDGDPAAAYRYTEARPAALAMELLADIDQDTVDTQPNFDDSRTEPTVLPSRIPNLLINGASGIAVGMATNLAPHNLGEVCDALIHMIDNFETIDEITSEQLRTFIPGPDFPTGGKIVGIEGIISAYATGRGRVIMRAKAEFEERPNDSVAIVVTEIPYQVNRSTLIERIAELARAKKIDTLRDLRDESDRDGMRIVMELKRGADPHSTLNKLYKFSQLQHTFGINALALVDGHPTMLPIKRMLEHYIEHRRVVIRRRSEHELKKAKHRQHVLEGLLLAMGDLDAVIDIIRKSRDAAHARERLMERLDLGEIQAQAILDMQLRRLAALESKRIQDEHLEVSKRIGYLETLLNDKAMILGVIRGDLVELKDKYADERRTEIIAGEHELTDADLIAEEDVLISITERGYIKRVNADTYRAQHRGGRGIIGAKTRDEDEVRDLVLASTRDRLLLFTDQGRVYQIPAWRVPASSREAAGTPLINLIQLEAGERVTVALAAPEWQFEHGSHLIMVTRKGRIKRTKLADYDGVRPSGLIAINLLEDDELAWVKITSGDDDVILISRLGMALRFHESSVRPQGRVASGVGAMRLRKGDSLAGVDIVREDADLFVITTGGYGKRTPLGEYRTLGRYNQGVQTIDRKRLDELGEIADARVVDDGDEITLISDHGIVMRTTTDGISRMGRSTRGVRVMNLDEGQQVASVAYMRDRKAPGSEDDDDGEGADGSNGSDGAEGSEDGVSESSEMVRVDETVTVVAETDGDGVERNGAGGDEDAG